MKSEKEIREALAKVEEQLTKEEAFLKDLPSIAFQRGEVTDEARNRYRNQIEIFRWILKEKS